MGITRTDAEQHDIRIKVAEVDVRDVERATLTAMAVAPPDRRTIRGRLEILIDADTDTVVGATVVGPQADAWTSELTLAVQHCLTAAQLRRTIRPFPTWSEAITTALQT